MVGAVALAGCGATDAAPEETGSGGSAHLDLLLSPVYYEAVYIAEQGGYFDDQDLDVTITEGGAASEQLPQIISGQVDIAMTSSVSVVQAIDKGLPVQIILGEASSFPDAPVTSGILVKEDSPVKGFGDLSGTTVAMQGLQDNTHLSALMAVKDDGGDPTSVQFVQLPLPSIVDSVANGDTDAGYPLSVFYSAGVQSGLRSLGSPTATALPYAPNVVYAATTEFIQDHTDELQRFNTAMTEATEAAMADDQLIRDVQTEHSTLPPEYIASAPVNPISTDIYRSGTQRMLDGMLEFDFISKEIPFDDAIASIAPVTD